MKYQNIISLGFFCGPAQEIKSIGLRNASYPFDWIISKFDSVLFLLKNNFEDFLEEKYLKFDNKELKDTYIVKNVRYDIKFFHDFKKNHTVHEQLKEVQEKYNRRINRLYENIKKPTLFIRYIKDEMELNYIRHNIGEIREYLRSFNENNEIVFICNSDLNKEDLIENIYWVQKDNNDLVNRHFLKNLKTLKKFIKENVDYKKIQRLRNIILYEKEELYKKYILKNK